MVVGLVSYSGKSFELQKSLLEEVKAARSTFAIRGQPPCRLQRWPHLAMRQRSAHQSSLARTRTGRCVVVHAHSRSACMCTDRAARWPILFLMKEHKKTAVLGYARVSTEEQAVGGVSLEAQRAKIKEYAAANGINLVEVVLDEGISGKRTDNRPGLQSAMKRLDSGEVGGLVVLKLDRLSRSTRDILDLVDQFMKRGWNLHSICEQIDTETANGRFVLTILAGLSQMEREQIGERTRLALAYKKSKGERVGSVPYGWQLAEDKRLLLENPAEQGVIRLVSELRQSGLSLRAIVGHLNDSQIPARGERWHLTTIARLSKILSN